MRGWEEIAHFDHKEIFVHFIIRKLYKYIILINLFILHNYYYICFPAFLRYIFFYIMSIVL